MKQLKNFSLLLILLLLGDFAMAQKKPNQAKVKAPQTNKSSSLVPPPPTQAAVLAPMGKPEKIREVEGISEYMLKNGLKVLLFPDESKQTITVNVTYLVGSRHENYGETGMAHLLEHLVFKGTPKHPNIPQELTAHGANPNGTTWLDRTNYFETLQASDENLNWALDMEADRMVNSYIARKDLDTEMTVVRNEFEMGENYPTNILMQKVTSAAFLWHNYGNTTIGSRADLENVNIERLQAFYKKYYQPDNAVLLVAGKIDEEKTLALIQKYFEPIAKPTRVIEKTYTLDPTQDGENEITLRRVGDVQVLCALYKVPAGAHEDFSAMSLATEILTDQPSGRLYKALIDTKKASQVYGFGFQTKEPGMIYLMAEVLKEKSLDSAKNILIDVVENFAKNPPTEEEVQRLKTKNLSQIDLMLNSSENVGLYLSEFIAQGDWRLLFFQRDRMKNLSVADMKRVTEKYFVTSNRTLGKFIPTEKPIRAEIPASPDLAELLKNYAGGEAKTKGEAFDPSTANIDKRTKTEKVGGFNFAFLPKKTRGESVNFQMTSRFGDLESLMGKKTISDLTHDMLNKGTKNKTRQQLQDALDKLKGQVYFYSVPNDITVNIQTEGKNLMPVLELVNDMLREPSFPVDELEKLKNEKVSFLEQMKSEPQMKVSKELQRHTNPYPKGHPSYVPTLDEEIADIKSVTIDQVKAFYKDFYGTSEVCVSAVGDFNETELKNTLIKQYGDWKSPKAFVRIPNQLFQVTTLNKSIEAPDKANSFYLSNISLPISDKYADYPTLMLANEILGGGFLNSRLATRIRQKEGISYGVGSFFGADSFDKTGSFGIYAIYAPENLPRLEVAIKEEIDKVVATGFTDKEIEEAKKGMLQNFNVSRSQDGNLVDVLCNNLYKKRTMNFNKEIEDRITNLTNQDLMNALKKHIVLSKMSVVKSGDFEGAAKKIKEKSEGKTTKLPGAQN